MIPENLDITRHRNKAKHFHGNRDAILHLIVVRLRDYKVTIRNDSLSFRKPTINRSDLSRCARTRNIRDYARERVTNYRQLSQVQRQARPLLFLLSLSLSLFANRFADSEVLVAREKKGIPETRETRETRAEAKVTR